MLRPSGARGPVGKHQRVRRHAEPGGGGFLQQSPHLCGGMEDGSAAVLHGVAAGGDTLVRCQAGVGCDQVNPARRDVQLLRGDLQQRGLQPLPKLGLAGKKGDAPVRRHPYPGIEQRHGLQAARQRGRGCILLAGAWAGRNRGRRAGRPGHDQAAASRQQCPA